MDYYYICIVAFDATADAKKAHDIESKNIQYNPVVSASALSPKGVADFGGFFLSSRRIKRNTLRA